MDAYKVNYSHKNVFFQRWGGGRQILCYCDGRIIAIFTIKDVFI